MKCSRCGMGEDLREILEMILEELRKHRHKTPKSVLFKEIIMLPPDPGNTLVFTGTIEPSGASFPSGTTFTATSVNSEVKVGVDPSGLVVTASISTAAVAGSDATITWQSSVFTPEPSSSPSQITSTIPLTISIPVPPPVPTPTAVTFAQTT